VPVGGTATITVRAVALTPGAAIPAGPFVLAQPPLATDQLRAAVFYGIDWGYAEAAPAQVALALWYLQDGVWRADDHAIAERISSAAATTLGTPSWLADGRNVLLAAAEGQAALSELALAPVTDSSTIGTGSLTVTNTGFADALFHLPYGTVFTGPSGSVIVWAAPALSGAQSTPSPQPAEPTAAPTSEVEPSATPVAEPQPPFASDPPVKGEPATPTPVLEATPTPGPKDVTATPEPATATPSPEPPTAAPTDTPVPAPQDTPAGVEDASRQLPGAGPAAPAAAPDPEVVTGKAQDQEQEGAPEAPLPPPGVTATADTEQGVPAPVGTSVSAGAQVPPPVATQPGDAIPSPVQTVIGTAPPGSDVPSPVASRQPTSPVRSTPPAVVSPSPTVEETVEPTQTAAPVVEATVEVPTPAPTPVPVPPTPDESTGEGPIINVAPGDTKPDTSGGAVEPSAGESTSSGMPQTYNPNTGGGGTLVPLWLGLLSAVMVLGGWSLRRVSRPAPVPLPDDAE
jgi:hypothetical protein